MLWRSYHYREQKRCHEYCPSDSWGRFWISTISGPGSCHYRTLQWPCAAPDRWLQTLWPNHRDLRLSRREELLIVIVNTKHIYLLCMATLEQSSPTQPPTLHTHQHTHTQTHKLQTYRQTQAHTGTQHIHTPHTIHQYIQRTFSFEQILNTWSFLALPCHKFHSGGSKLGFQLLCEGSFLVWITNHARGLILVI